MKLLDIMHSPWSIQPEKLAEIQDIYARHLKGKKIDLAGMEARIDGQLQNRAQGYEVVQGVAVIPVIGVIGKRMNFIMQLFGGVSTEQVASDFKAAMADPDVTSILLEIDSPGGTVDGTSELAQLIRDSRGEKPIVTWANGLMASSGYWIGSAAHQVYNSSDTTIVGSIGVVTRHIDFSKFDEKLGVKRTYLYAGKYKAVGADNEPLSDDDREIIQSELDYLYSIFVETVAEHRGVDVSAVLDNMAEGRIFTGQQAIDAGLVDGVATLDGLIAAMSGGELPDPSEVSAGVLSLSERGKAIAVLAADLHDSAQTETEQEAIMPDKDKIQVTKGYVLEHAPDVAEAFRDEGKALLDVETIKADAAKAERERIESVLDQSMPGFDAMIKEMAFDGKTTGPEAAVKILQAEKEKRSTKADDLHADGKELTLVKPSADNGVVETGAGEVDADAPIEERTKAAWDKDAKLRSEFNNDYDCYLAFTKAEENGQVKMLRTASDK